jgi:hypothetical protein
MVNDFTTKFYIYFLLNRAFKDFMGIFELEIWKFVGKEIVEEYYAVQSREGKKDIVSGEVRLQICLKV